VLGSILHCIGDVDLVSDNVDAVGSEARRKLRIGERTAQRGEVRIAIENLDFSAIEVRRQKKGAVERRQAFINRAAGRVIESHGCRVACANPAGDEAILSLKNELPAIEISAASVETLPVGQPGLHLPFGLCVAPGIVTTRPVFFIALVIIASGSAAAVIDDPRVLPRKNRNPPGVQQLRICSYWPRRQCWRPD